MTTGYNAGLDSSNIVVSYAKETAWSVVPAVPFQAIRILSEDFTSSKTRTRPLEINPSGFAQHSITTKVESKGSFNFALSYGTFDDFIAGALNNSWSSYLAITGAGGDIAMVAETAGVGTLTSTTSGKFTSVVPGQWFRTAGFTNAVNNGIWLATAVTGTSITFNATDAGVAVVTVSETPTGTNAILRGSYVQNGSAVQTFWFEKQLAAALFLEYAGAYVSSMQLTMDVGKFVEGVFNFLVKSEVSGVTTSSTGAVTVANTNRVMDNINGFKYFNLSLANTPGVLTGTAPTSVLQSVQLNISKQRSASQYGIGSSAAVGMRRGTLQVDGKLSLFFHDFTYYNDFLTETDLRINWMLSDNLGQTYVITLCAVTIMNPAIVAKGIDQDIVADFTLEGNPALATDPLYPNLTIQIDRIPLT